MNSTFGSRVKRSGRGITAGLAALLLLAACDENGEFTLGTPAEESATDTGPKTRTTDKDVESPEVFYALEQGLWDGRPSLGGVWVAYPNVPQPERVMIRNKDNGKFVVGALFRRISNQPGPALQLSSDAAAAIDVLAGAPVTLEVVALRKEVIVIEEPVEEPPEEPEEAAPEDSAEETPAAEDAAPDEDSAAAAVPAAAATAEAVAASGSSADDTIAAASAAIEASAPASTAPAATATSVETTEVVASTLPESTLDKPFLQAVTVSSEENAKNAVDSLEKSGLKASFKTDSSGDKTLWRILVGPAGSEAERNTMLETLKNAGFADAYAVAK